LSRKGSKASSVGVEMVAVFDVESTTMYRREEQESGAGAKQQGGRFG
jgi:hypothetical protein